MENTKTKENRFSITTRNGDVIILDKETVIKYLTDNKAITDPEFNNFFQLCKVYKVNPFLKEAYIIKYGDQPATIVLDYKVLQQIAETNKNYRGMRHGVIVTNANGEALERLGEYTLPGETLIAGWCEVLRSDRECPTKVVAMFEEFKAVKKSGEVNTNWSTKPCFMICKVAKAQALREAFPNLVGSNVYISEEMDSVKEPTPTPTGKTTVSNSIAEEDVVETDVKPAEKTEEKEE